MPMRPDNHRRIAAFCALAWAMSLVLTGCATTDSPGSATREAPPPALQQIAARLPGGYVSVRKDDRSAQTLDIAHRPGETHDKLKLSMVQQDIDGGNIRRYGLELEPTAVENRLDGRFALLDEADRVQRSCPMRFHLTDKGLVGETEPGDCLFGQGPEAVGLLKEILFDGRRITIGDRLIDPDSGESRGDDRVIDFLPAPVFDGWLGVREGGEWRVARNFELRAGEAVEPQDAADMSLGHRVELQYYRMERNDSAILMRLSVVDSESGEVTAEAWAEPGSSNLGVALPDLQVGLGAQER